MPDLDPYSIALDVKRVDLSALLQTITDPEKLLRLHPHWHIEEITTQKSGAVVSVRDHATDKPMKFDLKIHLTDDRLIVQVDSKVTVKWELAAEKGVLRPSLLVGELETVESCYQLSLWLNSVFHYLRLHIARNPFAAITRFVMDRAILQMNPSQRKICLMLMRFTVLEVVIIITIGVGAFFFMR